VHKKWTALIFSLKDMKVSTFQELPWSIMSQKRINWEKSTLSWSTKQNKRIITCNIFIIFFSSCFSLYKNLINEANSKNIKLSSIADYDLGSQFLSYLITITFIIEWAQKKEQEFRQEFSKKESELKLHIANNIKPSIQVNPL